MKLHINTLNEHIQLKLLDNCLPLLPALEESNKIMVATNRFIVNHIFYITITLQDTVLHFTDMEKLEMLS
jgi:hypothetical protein